MLASLNYGSALTIKPNYGVAVLAIGGAVRHEVVSCIAYFVLLTSLLIMP